VIQSKCGVVVTHTMHDCYNFLKSVGHRGREATGIMGKGPDRIDVLTYEGPIISFDLDDLHKIFPGNMYHTFIGHNRYATKGKKDEILKDAQPITIGGERIDYGKHVMVRNCDAAIAHNGEVQDEYFGDLLSKKFNTGSDSEKLLRYFLERGEFETLRNIPGAYTAAFVDRKRNEVVLARDRKGIQPGVIGKKDGKGCMASEDISFIENGGDPLEDMVPGSVYYFNPEGGVRPLEVVPAEHSHCMFGWQYLSDVNSILDKVSVRTHRFLLGEEAAVEFPPSYFPGDIDFVSYVPRCPEGSAWAYHRRTGIPFEHVFYKPEHKRSFQGSTSEDRKESIENNLFLETRRGFSLKGKTGLFLEDSIVRGNVIKRARHLLYDVAGLKEAYFLSLTPPICGYGDDGEKRYCDMGIDMPRDPAKGDDYIARGRLLEEISKKLQTNILYLSKNGMFKAFNRQGLTRDNLCYFCIGGPHPLTKVPVGKS
jgi:glutamine phosphoribosylpyrophosphate amidotransferase